MLAAILTLSGMTLTSCSTNDLPVDNNPLAEQLEGVWYAKYDAEGTINDLYENYEAHYTYVVEIYRFDEDSISVWNRYFFDGDDEEPITDLGGGSNGLGAFTYTSKADGTVSVTLSNTESAPEANRKDYLPLTRTLRLEGDKLSAKGVDGQDITMRPDNIYLEKKIVEWNTALHGGSGDLSHNPNDIAGPLGFNNSYWRSKETILIFDDGNHWARGYHGYSEIALPWSKNDVQTNLPMDFCDDITPENGWELVLNRCGYDGIPNENFFFLYNKYMGIMRIFYYMPEHFTAGNDHVWEISMTDNLALRSPWRYGIPEDVKINDKSAIGQTSSKTMINYVTPWSEYFGIDGTIVPKTGWWAFDVDMSNYRPDLDFSNEQIELHLRSVETGQTTLLSYMMANIDGSLTADINLNTQTKQPTAASSFFNGLGKIGKLVGNVAAAVAAGAEGNFFGCFSAVGNAFGAVSDLAGTCGGGGVTGYEGSLNGKLNLGLNGSINTQGFTTSSAVTTGIASPKIYMKQFDVDSKFFGKGVWNLKTSPVIYMTNQLLRYNYTDTGGWGAGSTSRYNDKYVPSAFGTKCSPRYGCLWFFDPSSVEVELNPNVFPTNKIDWIQVDAICGAHPANGITATDPFRKAFGLQSRNLGRNNAEDYVGGKAYADSRYDDSKAPFKYILNDGNEVLTNFYYGVDNNNGLSYIVQAPLENIGGRIQSYYGVGKDGNFILEPQMAVPVWYEACVAPPVEVNVQVSVKMQNDDKIYVFNRIFLPEIKTLPSTQDDLTKFYNDIKAHKLSEKQNGHRDTYDYHIKRTFDKIKKLFPDANISK